MKKEKILVVNAKIDVCRSLRDCLGKEYEILCITSLKEALAMFKEGSFNIVMTELGAPEKKGIEVVRKFKELKGDTTMIMITTHDSIPLAVEAMKVGAYDYITRPFNLDELKLVVLHALEREKLKEEARKKAIYQELALLDELTKIYNRRYIEEILRREVDRARRYPQKFSLLMVDVDNFKKCNDTYGHSGGDKILEAIACILLSQSRKTDFTARFGGEEFVIVAPHAGKKEASFLAARIVHSVYVKDFILDNSAAAKVTVSVGVATFPDDASTKEELVRTADKALYQAKKLGKNRACLFGVEEV